MSNRNRNGAIVYQGPSLLDGSPIVAIITGLANASANTKTGGMLQVYILRSDVHPMEALKLGLDTTICGVCPHKSRAAGGSGACYVQVGKAPAGIWKAFQRGAYQLLSEYSRKPRGGARMTGLENLAGRKVRFGAYGDPAAVPVHVWEELAAACGGNVTGYTHQWRTAAPEMAKWCMASADSIAEGIVARHRGYRNFIVRTAGDAKPRGAVVCPASAEAGKRVQCSDCMQCGGTSNGRKSDITIIAHGATARRFAPLPLAVL